MHFPGKLTFLLSCSLALLASFQARATTVAVNDNTSAPYLGISESPDVTNDQFYIPLNRNVNGLIFATASTGQDTMADIEAAPDQWFDYQSRIWVANHPNGIMVVGVSMFPGQTGSGGTPGYAFNDPNTGSPYTLALGAAKNYNSDFQTLATNLVSYHMQNAIIRIGREFQGSWYPWHVASHADALNYAQFFREIVIAMRSVPGQNFKFMWGGSQSTLLGSGWTIDDCYPTGQDASGKDYVDYVGDDVYDYYVGTGVTDANSWNYLLNTAPQSISVWRNEASSHSKPFCIPEWGLSVGSGTTPYDDSSFITNMSKYIQESDHNVYYAAYYDQQGSKMSYTYGVTPPFPSSWTTYQSIYKIGTTAIGYSYKFLPYGVSGYVMDAYLGGGAGSKVDMNTPNGSTAQTWVITNMGTNVYKISPSYNSSLVVTASANPPVNSSTINLQTDSGANNQRWLMLLVSGHNGDSGYFAFSSLATATGTPAGQSGEWLSCSGTPSVGSQLFTYVWGGSGSKGQSWDLVPAAPAATPTFSVATDMASVLQFPVTLTSTAGSTIYYTTDGTTPTTSSSYVATGGSVMVTKSETINASAIATGYVMSAVGTASYTVTGALAGGDTNTLALKSDGTVALWGYNGYSASTSTPTAVSGLTNVVSIASAHNNQFAVTGSGALYAWGNNSFGQWGTGSTGGGNASPQMILSSGVLQVAACGYFTVILKNDGTVWTTGGNGTTPTTTAFSEVYTSSAQTTFFTGAKAIYAGGYAAYIIKTDGTLWAWGRGSEGELGNGSTASQTYPVQVTGLTGVTGVAAGIYHAIALESNGNLYAFGSNSNGQLGIGNTTSKSSPTQITTLSNVASISSSPEASHNIAILEDSTNSVWTWGINTDGQLGNGNTTQSTSPIQVKVDAGAGDYLTGGIIVTAGANHTVATKAGVVIWSWGYNSSGQLGNGNTTTEPYPVSTTGSFMLAMFRSWYHFLALEVAALV